MSEYNNTPTLKQLIRRMRYARYAGLAATYNIVISDYMRRHGFPQRPQVKHLSMLRHFYLLDPTYFNSYQVLMRLFVLEPLIHVAMTNILSCSRIPMYNSSCERR